MQRTILIFTFMFLLVLSPSSTYARRLKSSKSPKKSKSTKSSKSTKEPVYLWRKLGQNIPGENEYDESGESVSLSSDGNTVAIGAPHNDGNNGEHSGHVRVYRYDADLEKWIQRGQDIDGENAGDLSGISVSLSSDGNTVAIGAPLNDDADGFESGHVRVYYFDETASDWVQRGKDIDGDNEGDGSGWSVSLSSDGGTVAIGAPGNDEHGDDSGHVRVYRYDDVLEKWWNRLGERRCILGESKNDQSGKSVSLSSDGNTVAIGAPFNDGNGDVSGHVRVYHFDDTTFDLIQLGQDIDGENAGDYSGWSVSLSSNGGTVAIGAHRNDGNGDDSGHVRVYRYDDVLEKWLQLGMDIDGENPVDFSGISVSLSSDGNTVAIGAHGNDDGIDNLEYDSGHVRVYRFDDILEEWVQLGEDIDGENFNDNAGISVSLSSDGETVAIGAPDGDTINGYRSGHVSVYRYLLA